MTLPDSLPVAEKAPENYKNSPYRLSLRAMLVLLLIVFVKESAAIYRTFDITDYHSHIQAATMIGSGIETNFPHLLYHAITIGIHTLIPWASYWAAGVLTGILAYLVLAGVMATSLHRQMRGRHPWTAVILTLALMLSAPILFLTLESGRYFGYQHPFTYHSPTTTLMRPLAVITFLYVAAAFLPPVATWRQILAAAFVSALLSNAKPNYNVALLPVAGLIMIYRLVRRLFVDLKMLVVILGAITFFLTFQYFNTFNSGSGGSGLRIQPLMILLEYRGLGIGEIIIKQMLSIVFPLVMLVAYWPVARRDSLLILAWGCFLVGWFYALCLVEVARAADNNFYWSGEVTLFVLFFASVHFWVRQMGGRFDLSTRRAQIVMAVWALHLVSGVFWYALQITRSLSTLS